MSEEKLSSRIAVFFVCVFVIMWLVIIESQTQMFSNFYTESYIERCIKKVDDAIKKGEYAEAYLIVDQMMASNGFGRGEIHDTGRELNEKILTNEIATNVEEGNTTRIILCIKERAKYNNHYREKEETKKMFKHAIQLATFVENDDMIQKLQNVLDTWEKEAAEEK